MGGPGPGGGSLSPEHGTRTGPWCFTGRHPISQMWKARPYEGTVSHPVRAEPGPELGPPDPKSSALSSTLLTRAGVMALALSAATEVPAAVSVADTCRLLTVGRAFDRDEVGISFPFYR